MRTTKKQFKYFEKCVNNWIDFFGISEYGVHIRLDKLEDDVIANCYRNTSGMVCTIELNSETGGLTSHEVNSSAFHEVVHLLLSRFAIMGYARHASKDEMYAEEEAIVRRMENSVFKELTKKKRVKK